MRIINAPRAGQEVYARMDGSAWWHLARVREVEPDAGDGTGPWVVLDYFGNGMPDGVSVAWSACESREVAS